jgi:hypothetical protein
MRCPVQGLFATAQVRPVEDLEFALGSGHDLERDGGLASANVGRSAAAQHRRKRD